jgi:organic radical activating enzyme
MKKEDGVRFDNLNVIITDICNKGCPMCVNAGFVNKQKRFMTKDIFKRGVKWATEHEKYGIKLNGGEPTLHPLINDFAIFAKEQGLGTYLFTNYSRPEIIKEMDKCGSLDRIIISNYDQPNLPRQDDFKTKLSLSTLLWNGRFENRAEFEKFIDEKRNQFDKVFFETLRPATQWARDNQFVDWLEEIFAEANKYDISFRPSVDGSNKKRKIDYRGCEIKFNTESRATYQRHNLTMDGEIHAGFDWQYANTVEPLEMV